MEHRTGRYAPAGCDAVEVRPLKEELKEEEKSEEKEREKDEAGLTIQGSNGSTHSNPNPPA